MRGKPDIDHIGYSIPAGPELLAWADYLSRQQTPILWGPGRHGAGNDLFLRFADVEDVHIELSAELQQYYDHDVTNSTTPVAFTSHCAQPLGCHAFLDARRSASVAFRCL